MTEVHALIQDAFIEASELVHVLPKRSMALLLEALATGSIVVQDTKAFNILQKAKAHWRIHEEIKTRENKMCAIDLQIERQRNCMLPNWKHSIFYYHKCGSKIGKIAAAVAVYVRFALGERCQDVPLKTVGEMFVISQRSVKKVITGKLYDSEERRVESIFKET